jgi:hypothetical protein
MDICPRPVNTGVVFNYSARWRIALQAIVLDR